LRSYSVLIKPGDYLIVEDSICHHGLSVGPEPGPYEAIETFVNENSDFEIDRSRESFLITWNPKGYLRRRSLSDENPSIKTSEQLPARSKEPKSSMKEILKLFIPPIFVQVTRRLRSLR